MASVEAANKGSVRGDPRLNPHFLFELCVSGRTIEPTPVFPRLWG